MKAVFTALNSKYTHTALPIYILSKCVSDDIDCTTAEFNINQTKDHILRKLYEENADVYLFSCYIWNINMILSVCSDLKKMRNCTIILGGSEVSYNPMDYVGKYADYIVCGEGENIVDELLHMIKNGEDPSLLAGVYDINKLYNGELTEKTAPMDMIFPYTDEELAEFKEKILYYESSRGCPHQCTYCLSGCDNKVRYKDIHIVYDELMRLINAGVRQVKFIDRTFNANPRRAEDIVEFIIKNNEKTNFHFEVTAENMTERLIKLLNSAPVGMFQIEAGLQSVNERTLVAIKRKNNLEKFSDNLQAVIKKQNVHVHADLIAALPYEGYDSFMNGIDFLFEQKVHMLQVGVLKVLKGSQIHAQTGDFGIKHSDNPPYNAFSSKWLSADDMIKIGYIEDIVEKYYNSMSFYCSLEKISGYFGSPHQMFETLAEYFSENKYFDRGISKKELYEILMNFVDEKDIPAKSEICLDSLKYYDMNNPPLGYFEKYDKTMTFELLSNEDFIKEHLPEYVGMRAKEIFKNVAMYDLGQDLLLISKIKDNDVKAGNRHKFIKKPCL
ncbi:MAG: DUF4080 domain-containing protein [Anaerofustis stercorihominis]|nr:DUF4080 domain-containing protein [Anaerofustis stercorihominis]